MTDTLIATYPIQSFLFAKIVDVFTKLNQNFVRRGDFLALMFCVLAFAVGTAFLILGWIAALIAAVSAILTIRDYIYSQVCLGCVNILPSGVSGKHFEEKDIIL
jgi:hypothetical protein